MNITVKDLETLAKIINQETGNPVEYFNKETKKWNIGNFCIANVSGNYKLVRIVNEDGAMRDITTNVTRTKLFDQMHVFLKGINFGKEGK